MLYKDYALAGFDTETVDGKCTVACFSTQNKITILIHPIFEDVIEMLLSKKVVVSHNLGYDVGAILRLLRLSEIEFDEDKMPITERLWIDGEAQYNNYLLSYIRDKCFVIRDKKRVSRIYDSASLCAYASLDSAVEEMLGEHKRDEDIDKELLGSSYEYQHVNMAKISRYCAWDAVLCRRLVEKILETIIEVTGCGVPRKLYSLAYIAASQVIHLGLNDDNAILPLEVELMFEDGFQGARIESLVCGRVRGEIWQHDIISAYPSIMRDIPSFWKGEWRRDDEGHTAVYRIEYDTYTPLWPMRVNGKRSYPIGIGLTAVVTREMLAFTRKHASRVKVIDVWSWYPIGDIEYPMREWVDKVYELKMNGEGVKKKIAKLLLNSLSGKYQQSGKRKGTVRGPLYHPVWAYLLVMQTHYRVLELAYRDWDSVIEICTDGVYASRKLCESERGIGNWEVEMVGHDGVWLGSGMRMIDGVTKACKGYKTLDMTKLPLSRTFTVEQIGPTSMGRAVRSHRADDINMWTTRYVTLSLDRDNAHMPIPAKYTLNDMLSTCIRRVPKMYLGEKSIT